MTSSVASDAVSRYFSGLDHPRAAEAAQLCALIRRCCPHLREGIKWNAPSYGMAGDDDCLTLRLYPSPAFQLVLHRGAKPHPSPPLHPKTPVGLVSWKSPDRGVVDFKSRTLASIEGDLARLIGEWVGV